MLQKRLVKNFLFSSLGKLSTVLIRLIQVPIIINLLGIERYGEWIVLTSLVTWITLSNLGFGSVAGNAVSTECAKGDYAKAEVYYSTALFCVIGLICILLPFLSLLIFNLNWRTILSIESDNNVDLQYSILILVIVVLLSFLTDVISSKFRANKNQHKLTLINSVRPWSEFLILVLVFNIGSSFLFLSISLLISQVLYSILIVLATRREKIRFLYKLSIVDYKLINWYIKKGVSFQALPLGHAMIIQGLVMVINVTLGSTSVAIFSTVRTLTRSINQLLELVNQIVWPEMTLLLAAKDLNKAAALHRLSVLVSIIFSICGIVVLSLYGEIILSIWTRSAFQMKIEVFFYFLIPIFTTTLWYTSSVTPLACNEHEGLTIRYLLASFLTIVVAFYLSKYYGLKGVALSIMIVDFVMIPYTLRRSLHLTGDNWRNFFKRILLMKDFKSSLSIFKTAHNNGF